MGAKRKGRWQHFNCLETPDGRKSAPPAPPEGFGPASTPEGLWAPQSVATVGPLVDTEGGPRVATVTLWRRLLVRVAPKESGRIVRSVDTANLPDWARVIHGASRETVAQVICRIIELLMGEAPNPHRCRGSASKLLAIWQSRRDLSPDEYLREWQLIHAALHHSPKHEWKFLRGDTGGTDYRRKISTLAVLSKYDDRLASAREHDSNPPDGSGTRPESNPFNQQEGADESLPTPRF